MQSDYPPTSSLTAVFMYPDLLLRFVITVPTGITRLFCIYYLLSRTLKIPSCRVERGKEANEKLISLFQGGNWVSRGSVSVPTDTESLGLFPVCLAPLASTNGTASVTRASPSPTEPCVVSSAKSLGMRFLVDSAYCKQPQPSLQPNG